jgi:CRP/FNR family transcriptional regulator
VDKVHEQIKGFFSGYPKLELKKGSVIIKPQEPLLNIYNIFLGYVKSYSINEDGMELTINILKPYSFFPITETFAGMTNNYFFEAVTDVVLQKAPTRDVHEFVKSHQDILFDLVKRISIGLEGFMIRTQYLIRSNATQKVSSSLVLLARRFGENLAGQKVKILIPQTHTDIANLSGVSRETASIELKKLQDGGIIAYKKQTFIINDFNQLRDLSVIYQEDTATRLSF